MKDIRAKKQALYPLPTKLSPQVCTFIRSLLGQYTKKSRKSASSYKPGEHTLPHMQKRVLNVSLAIYQSCGKVRPDVSKKVV